MTAYTGAPISDPDQLGYEIAATDIATDFGTATEEILIDTANKRIALKVVGNLGTDGVNIKAVYSKLKDAWRADTNLIKYKFPMGPITDESFEMINGWNWDKTQTSITGGTSQNTVQLLRTGGWQVLNGAGAPTEMWASIISLGTLGTTDQVYFQQVNELEQTEDFVLTDRVNQAIQIFRDDNGDGTPDYDKRSYLKVFCREWQKIYAQSDIDGIGVSELTFQAYRFPLTNSTDLNVDASELTVSSNTPYTDMSITYYTNFNIIGDWVSGSNYVQNDVVRDTSVSPARWFKLTAASLNNSTTVPSTDTGNWSAYTEGERAIGDTGDFYYAFNIIIDGDTTTSGVDDGAASIQEIYEFVQWSLRQANTDIDDGTGLVYGSTADSLLSFVGPTLVTAQGVYIDSFNSNDTNSIEFYDYSNTLRQFPFVATLTINFGTNLQDDQYAKYWVFYTTTPNANNFGTDNAMVVLDNDNNPMANDVNPSWPTKRSQVVHTYNYDFNTDGGRVAAGASSVAPAITAVAIGLTSGQYVVTGGTDTIARTKANSVSLIAAKERNYAEGSNTTPLVV